MIPLEDKLRAALRETADEIPAIPPPLRLSPPLAPRRGPVPLPLPLPRRWISWATPLAAAAVVLAVVAASLALTGGPRRTASAPADTGSVPPYYVALTAPAYPDVYAGNATVAEVRATVTGAVLAKVVPPRPYVAFTGVTAAAGDRAFVLAAQETDHPSLTDQQLKREYPQGYIAPARFFLLRIGPGGAVTWLTPLPARFIPPHATLHDMALSPDGNFLAADISGDITNRLGSKLYVFNLTTGTMRTWYYHTAYGPSTGGLGYAGVSPDSLSWTADGTHIAFAGPDRLSYPARGTVRLLDVTLPGTDLLANSRTLAGLPAGDHMNMLWWRGVIVTPDGRTVVMVEELATNGAPIRVRDRLLKVSVATGRVTVVNDLNVLAGYEYEQIMYASAGGDTLVVSGARKGHSAGILRGDAYTPIPWDRHIATAIW
jgi:hypothetical protein